MVTRAFGTPITFEGCMGFVHDGGGTTGVLMLPAWGFEEFTIHRGWARFADLLANSGYCCLRFDWPGAGDSLGDAGLDVTLSQWRQAVASAADLMRTRYGVDTLVVIGHGVGGLIAPHVAESLSASAMVLMAPQNEGRPGIRELDMTGKLVGSFLRLPDLASDVAINVAGHSLARSLAAEISALRISSGQATSPLPVLTVLRADTRAAAEWPARLREAGFAVTASDYTAYDRFLAYDRASIAPIEDFERVRNWLIDTVSPGSERTRPAAEPVEPLCSEGFTEQPMVFGPNKRLFGVLCKPEGRPCRATVILINSGDTYHIGWGRMHVQFARRLAGTGIASFRIDTSGIGDSQAIDRPLYFDDAQIQDVLSAINPIDDLHMGPIMVYGLCSGAYSAVQAAVRDPRVRAVIAVNPVRLAISKDETFEDVVGGGTASLAEYKRRALSMSLLRDIVHGNTSPLTVLKKVARIVKARLIGLYRRKLLRNLAKEQAAVLRSRHVKPILIFAESDAGLDELERLFGNRAPGNYDHAHVRVVEGSEHNMTAPFAREAIVRGIIEASELIHRPGPGSQAVDDMPNKRVQKRLSPEATAG